jgi:hypothetical protein
VYFPAVFAVTVETKSHILIRWNAAGVTPDALLYWVWFTGGWLAPAASFLVRNRQKS